MYNIKNKYGSPNMAASLLMHPKGTLMAFGFLL